MKRHHPRPDILRLLERRALSGLTYRAISEESGIPIPTLSYWAAKERRSVMQTEAPTQFVPVELEDETPSRVITIEIGNSARVVVESGFDEEHLARILAVLAQC
jgi:transcriptional regulator with XRE-family HTH domain